MDYPPCFRLKKYIIIGVATIDCLILLSLAVFSGAIMNKLIDNHTDHFTPNDKSAGVALIVTTSIIGILFQLLGLISAWKEHFVLFATYMVLQVLSVLSNFVSAFKNPSLWSSTVWSAIVCTVGVLYLKDLYTIRRGQQQWSQGGVA